ncbi:hypothetical protein JCM3774_000985, partial [Rhodotorula dairenensis]
MAQPIDAEVAAEQVNDGVRNEDLAAEEEAAAASVEVTLLIPTQSFIQPSAASATTASDGFLELPLPIALTDAVHDLRAIITDAPEGFWLGAFSLAPYYADEIAANGTADDQDEDSETRFGPWQKLLPPPRKSIAPGEVDTESWNLNEHGVLGDFSDLTAVFGGDAAQWAGKKRGLKVIL